MCAEILALIEDHDGWSQVIQSLARSGHRVHTFDNYTDAIKDLKQQRKIDLIISDVHLRNGGDVFDFLRWVKKDPERAATPFVMLSLKPTQVARYLEDGVRISARILGASQYIRLDEFDSDSLRQQIELSLPSEEKRVELPSVENGE